MIKFKNIKGKKVTLIGGGGFIGHNMALFLQKLGAEVTIIDSFQVNNFVSLIANSDNVENPRLLLAILNERLNLLLESGIKIKAVDARDYQSVSAAIETSKPNVIVHLAAISHSNRSNKDPFSTYDHSLRTLENSLDCYRDKLEHFIFFSSSMVYGNFKKDTVDEETHCDPIGIYGSLKFAAEKIIKSYNQVFNLPYTIIRPSALYGERCISRRVGQIFIENALLGNDIKINGDGKEKLDFTYIQDLVEGIATIIDNPKSKNNIFNMTYGKSRSINDLLEILKPSFPNLKVQYEKRDKLMPVRGTLSMDKAKTILGFEPRWGLDEGYKEYINWYKELFESYKKTNKKNFL
jgi:nucleoside-diphosphate-sugar epimerase